MTKSKSNKDRKAAELIKYRDLMLATLDYLQQSQVMKIKTSNFDSEGCFMALKAQTIEHFEKGRLTRLKQWFRDMTEILVATGDLKFNQYLQEKTGYQIDIFESFFDRVEKVLQKGKITTDTQFYDIKSMMDDFTFSESLDNEKIELLDKLLAEYKPRKKLKG